jgi:hypothetical protein
VKYYFLSHKTHHHQLPETNLTQTQIQTICEKQINNKNSGTD